MLIALAVGSVTGRILSVNSIDLTKIERQRIDAAVGRRAKQFEEKGISGGELEEKLTRVRAEYEERLRLQRPFLSANDRSRWCTIRALVDHGTYEIDAIITDSTQYPVWNTIDMVKHEGDDGQPHLYSTKPPLFPTLVAGEYWLIKKLTGLTLKDNTHTVVRIILITVNVTALVIFLLMLARLVERYGTTDWGRLLVMVAATAGTFLTTFAVSLNNHIIAAVCVIVAVDAAMRILYEDERRLRYFFLCVASASFAVAVELPALLLLALVGLLLLWKYPRQTLVAGVPAALLVLGAAVGTNYTAHGTIKPAYAMRDRGNDEQGKPRDWTNGNWYNYTFEIHDPHNSAKSPRVVQSYWSRDEASLARRSAVDRGEPSRSVYAMHMLVGHHGIFSLTPIWLFSLAGMITLCVRKEEPSLRLLGGVIVTITLVVFFFYLMQPQENRNFGGVTTGLRWTFWLVPLWLLALLPAADWSAESRSRRIAAGICVALSVMSASFATWNPWTHPWMSQMFAHLGWIEL